MDRQIIYPGQVPLETDLLNTNKNVLIALSKLAAAILGTSVRFNGLSCLPNSPAALNVVVQPGEIYSLQNIDGTAYSSIAADTTHSILKQGILLDGVTLSCPAPATAGQSINYLVQIAYQDVDTGAVVLPYYNASNPSQAYSGPNNAGTPNNTIRQGACVVSVKAGTAATTGTQTTPSPDAGYTGAHVVTVANGQSTIVAGNISTLAGAPFITETLTQKISQATGDARYALAGTQMPQLQPLTGSATSNLLAASLAATPLTFRSPTLSTGGGTQITTPSLSIAVPTIAASLGAITAVPAKIAVLIAYNSGTPVMCLANIAGGVDLGETGLISPTTISAGSTSAGVIYSASAVAANSPYRVVGYMDATWTSGTGWTLTKVQPQGGLAMAAFGGLGFGQTMQSVVGSRAFNTNYTNTTGKPLVVSGYVTNTGGALTSCIVNGVVVSNFQGASGAPPMPFLMIVPVGGVYQLALTAGTATLGVWAESLPV